MRRSSRIVVGSGSRIGSFACTRVPYRSISDSKGSSNPLKGPPSSTGLSSPPPNATFPQVKNQSYWSSAVLKFILPQPYQTPMVTSFGKIPNSSLMQLPSSSLHHLQLSEPTPLPTSMRQLLRTKNDKRLLKIKKQQHTTKKSQEEKKLAAGTTATTGSEKLELVEEKGRIETDNTN
jgi:hypothetical protein